MKATLRGVLALVACFLAITNVALADITACCTATSGCPVYTAPDTIAFGPYAASASAVTCTWVFQAPLGYSINMTLTAWNSTTNPTTDTLTVYPGSQSNTGSSITSYTSPLSVTLPDSSQSTPSNSPLATGSAVQATLTFAEAAASVGGSGFNLTVTWFAIPVAPGAPATVPDALAYYTTPTTFPLYWTAPADFGSPAFITKYVLYYGTDSSNLNNVVETANNGTTLTLTGLTPNTGYYIAASACNPTGCGTNSSASSLLTTAPVTQPLAPTAASLYTSPSGTTTIVFQVTPSSSDGGFPVNGYNVIYSSSATAIQQWGVQNNPGGSSPSTQTASLDPYGRVVLTSASTGTNYFALVAQNSQTSSSTTPASPVVGPITTGSGAGVIGSCFYTAPSSPDIIYSTVNTITLGIQAPSTAINGCPISTYAIAYSNTSGGVYTAAPWSAVTNMTCSDFSSTTYAVCLQVSGLNSSQSYTFEVAANSSNIVGLFSTATSSVQMSPGNCPNTGCVIPQSCVFNTNNYQSQCQFNTAFLPAAPANNVDAYAYYITPTSLPLYWSAPATLGTPAFITKYRIYYGTSSSSLNSVIDTPTNGTTYNMTGLPSATSFYFYISACNPSGCGQNSTSPSSAVTTAAATQPLAPTSISLYTTPTGSSLIVFSATPSPSDGGYPINGYTAIYSTSATAIQNWGVQLNPTSGNPASMTASMDPFGRVLLSNAPSGANYYALVAQNSQTSSSTTPASEVIGPITLGSGAGVIGSCFYTAPSTPDIIYSTVNTITLGIQAPSTAINGCPISTYSIAYTNTSGGLLSVAPWSSVTNMSCDNFPISTTYAMCLQISGLNSSQSYSFEVAANSSNIVGLFSSATSFVQMSPGNCPNTGCVIPQSCVFNTNNYQSQCQFNSAFLPSSPPNDVDAYRYYMTPTTLSLYWTAPSTLGTPAFITKYRLYYGPTSSVQNFVIDTPTNATTYNFTGLTPGSSYWFALSACNPSGCSANNTGQNYALTTPAATQPAAPTALSLYTTPSGTNTIVFQVTPPTNTGGYPITGYNVLYTSTANFINSSGVNYQPSGSISTQTAYINPLGFVVISSASASGPTYFALVAQNSQTSSSTTPASQVIGPITVGSGAGVIGPCFYTAPSTPDIIYSTVNTITLGIQAPSTAINGCPISTYSIAYTNTSGGLLSVAPWSSVTNMSCGNFPTTNTYSMCLQIAGLNSSQSYSFEVAANSSNIVGLFSSATSFVHMSPNNCPNTGCVMPLSCIFNTNNYQSQCQFNSAFLPSSPPNDVDAYQYYMTSTTLSLYWTAPSTLGTPAFITKYRLYYGTSSSVRNHVIDTPTNATTYNFTGLTPGTSYWFALSACNPSGCSANNTGQSYSIRTPAATQPAAPTAVSLYTTPSGTNTIVFQVTPPTNTGGYPITSYNVLYASTASSINSSGVNYQPSGYSVSTQTASINPLGFVYISSAYASGPTYFALVAQNSHTSSSTTPASQMIGPITVGSGAGVTGPCFYARPTNVAVLMASVSTLTIGLVAPPAISTCSITSYTVAYSNSSSSPSSAFTVVPASSIANVSCSGLGSSTSTTYTTCLKISNLNTAMGYRFEAAAKSSTNIVGMFSSASDFVDLSSSNCPDAGCQAPNACVYDYNGDSQSQCQVDIDYFPGYLQQDVDALNYYVASTSIPLYWVGPSTTGIGVSLLNYRIYYKTYGGGYYSVTTPTAASSYTLTGLIPDTQYFIMASACNIYGCGQNSSVSGLSTAPAYEPSAPTGLALLATPTGTRIIVFQVTAPTSNGGYPINGYNAVYTPTANAIQTWGQNNNPGGSSPQTQSCSLDAIGRVVLTYAPSGSNYYALAASNSQTSYYSANPVSNVIGPLTAGSGQGVLGSCFYGQPQYPAIIMATVTTLTVGIQAPTAISGCTFGSYAIAMTNTSSGPFALVPSSRITPVSCASVTASSYSYSSTTYTNCFTITGLNSTMSYQFQVAATSGSTIGLFSGSTNFVQLSSRNCPDVALGGCTAPQTCSFNYNGYSQSQCQCTSAACFDYSYGYSGISSTVTQTVGRGTSWLALFLCGLAAAAVAWSWPKLLDRFYQVEVGKRKVQIRNGDFAHDLDAPLLEQNQL